MPPPRRSRLSTLQPMESPMPEQMMFPEVMAAHGEPTPEQRKGVRRKERQRETTMYRPWTLTPMHRLVLGGKRCLE